MSLRDRIANPWGRKDGPSPALTAALADLERLASARPELADAARGLGPVLIAAFQEPVPIPTLAAASELIVAGWRAGVPAVRAGDEPPRLDADDLRRRASAVCAAVRDRRPEAEGFAAALRAGRVDLPAGALAVLSDQPEAVDALSRSAGVSPPFARSVLRLSLLPTLDRLNESLSSARTAGEWTGLGCPTCGGEPCLIESRGLEQRRHVRCGLCAAEWPAARLFCPFCGETDHRRLHFRFFEGEEDRRRLSLCESCGGAVKVVSTLAPISAPALLVAELELSDLDALRDEPDPPS